MLVDPPTRAHVLNARARWRPPQSDAEGPEAMVARVLGPERGTNTGEATTGKVRNGGVTQGK